MLLKVFSLQKGGRSSHSHLYPEPHSYTGEEMVEIMCHGNPAIAELIIESLLDAV